MSSQNRLQERLNDHLQKFGYSADILNADNCTIALYLPHIRNALP